MHFPEFLLKLTLYVTEFCGTAVFITFVIVRAFKEIRSIIKSERKDK